MGDGVNHAEGVSSAISSTQADWSREALRPGEWNPGKRLLASLRDYQRLAAMPGPVAALRKKWAVLRHRFWSTVSGADIQLNTHLSGGLVLPHPNGVVFSPDVVVGPNCMIFQQVTLGTRSESKACPVLGAGVTIGAGAKVLGGVTIGAHAVIGANAVVLADVPPGAVAVGIPARVLAGGNPSRQ